MIKKFVAFLNWMPTWLYVMWRSGEVTIICLCVWYLRIHAPIVWEQRKPELAALWQRQEPTVMALWEKALALLPVPDPTPPRPSESITVTLSAPSAAALPVATARHEVAKKPAPQRRKKHAIVTDVPPPENPEAFSDENATDEAEDDDAPLVTGYTVNADGTTSLVYASSE
ncbi:MAG: hypothetical protein RLZZ324_1286 [Candidatus Parcubacteria bacterium]|jgi:hypothetical protein